MFQCMSLHIKGIVFLFVNALLLDGTIIVHKFVTHKSCVMLQARAITLCHVVQAAEQAILILQFAVMARILVQGMSIHQARKQSSSSRKSSTRLQLLCSTTACLLLV